VQFLVRGVNNHEKLYNQGMRPCVKTEPSSPQWMHTKGECHFRTEEEENYIVFRHTFEYNNETTYFAFTFPFSYTDCQTMLEELDIKYDNHSKIYYHRELLTNSIEGRKIDLITISSFKDITDTREQTIPKLFPDNQPRPLQFTNKSTYFLSARVHPGETPASHIFNGFLKFILEGMSRAIK
jgi:hypothetical protein